MDTQTKPVDWGAMWRHYYEQREHAQLTECALLWTSELSARRYLEAIHAHNPEWYAHTVDDFEARSGERILDIGAGPGTLAIPLTRRGCTVTAVEPSPGMITVLKEEAAREDLPPITCITKRWEDVDPDTDLDAPYDRVAAAFSLGMPDISTAIRKMTAVCSGTVSLFWFAGPSTQEERYRGLWPRLHGHTFHPQPKGDMLVNILADLDITPEITTFPLRTATHFASIEEAAETFRPRLQIETARQERIMIEFLGELLEEQDDSLVWHNSATCMKLHWSVNG